MSHTSDTLVTTTDVARLFRVSSATVTRWATSGALKGFQTPGKQWRFRRSDVDAFMGEERAS